MNLADTFPEVARIANAASNPTSGWASLRLYLEACAGKRLQHLEAVSIEDDVELVHSQLEALVGVEPPPRSISAVYFGLFDAVDDDDLEQIGYFVAGIVDFDPSDGDSLCDPAWWPDQRYLSSSVLDAVKAAELGAASSGDHAVRALLGYSGQLGAAALISRFAARGVFSDLRRIVGFDSGDFTEVAP